jgi:uncharacterized phiE125 gp8 family phage protein
MTGGLSLPIVKLSEAQAFLRIETGEEEALLAGLIRTASGLCEAFINQIVIARDFELEMPASGACERVDVTPVRSLTEVEAVDSSGAAMPLAPGSYAVDIDSAGDGWVRVTSAGCARRIRVGGTAGMSDDENGVPEPIRQGVLRLVAHMFTVRDGDDGEPPAAVTALWRPYRRLRLSR